MWFDYAFQKPRNQAKPWFWSRAELNLLTAGWYLLTVRLITFFQRHIFRNAHGSHGLTTWIKDCMVGRTPPARKGAAALLARHPLELCPWAAGIRRNSYLQVWALEEIECLGAFQVLSVQTAVARGVSNSTVPPTDTRRGGLLTTMCCPVPSQGRCKGTSLPNHVKTVFFHYPESLIKWQVCSSGQTTIFKWSIS